jgi:hypothetical protein
VDARTISLENRPVSPRGGPGACFGLKSAGRGDEEKGTVIPRPPPRSVRTQVMKASASLVSFLLLVSLAAPVAAGECGSVVRIRGEGVLPATVTTLLLEQGVGPAPSHCDAVVATVTRSEDGVLLRIEDAEGRSQEHLVANAPVAAVVIESWVRDDLYASLLPVPRQTVRVAAASPPPLAEPSTHLSIGFSADAGGANDQTTWAGGTAAACVRLDVVCIGAMVRFVSDIDWTGVSARLQTNRQGYEAALSADFPLELWGRPLVPGVGLGFRSLEIVADEDISDTRVAVQSSQLLVTSHLRTNIRLDRLFLLEFSLNFDLYPTAHRAPYRVAQDVKLAGDPLWSAGAGLGFRIGAW